MSRSILLVAATGLVAVTTGCDIGSAPLAHQSTLQTAARGVVLHDASDMGDPGAQVGMNGTTCEVDTAFGNVGSDHNYPGSNDSVDDVVTGPTGEPQVIITGDDSVHVQDSAGDWSVESRDYTVPGAVTSRAYDGGAIVLTDAGSTSCGLTTVGTTADSGYVIKDEVCAGVHTLETDPTAGTAWVGSDSGLWEFDGSNMVNVNEQPANIVAYDPYTDALYTAEAGGTVVRALETDGTERWSTDVGGLVYSLDGVGAEEAVAVSINYDDGSGTGSLVFLDGWTGEVKAEQFMNSGNNRVTTSRDGKQLALDNGSRVEFYAVNDNLQGSNGGGLDWGDWADSDIEWSF